jgi:hypothetical protein
LSRLFSLLKYYFRKASFSVRPPHCKPEHKFSKILNKGRNKNEKDCNVLIVLATFAAMPKMIFADVNDRLFDFVDPLYVFPTRTGNPIGPGNNRQADIVDLSGGYFSNDSLGLWIHIWINYTDRAFSTRDGQKMLADLQRKNGIALDGTPIIKTLSELNNLLSKNFAAKRLRNPDGSEDPMYGICPVIEDPTDGGIAPGDTLNYVRKPDGTPLEPEFLRQFNSLQTTGREAN